MFFSKTISSKLLLLQFFFFCKVFSDSVRTPNESFDFIIVGGGTAGCVLANRLSEVPEWKILLVESGSIETIDDDIPAMPPQQCGPAVRRYFSAPATNCCLANPEKQCIITKSKVLGGSSVTGNMMYARGNRHDFDSWECKGCTQWTFDKILKYYKKSEKNDDPDIARDKRYHSTNGLQNIKRFDYRDPNIFHLIKAWNDLGLDTLDFNAEEQESIMIAQFAQKNNTRLSVYSSFIRPIQNRSNLVIRSNVGCVKLIINPASKTALGISYTNENFEEVSSFIKKELIISAGSVQSPCLLMNAGIGPKEHLVNLDIPVIVDRPGVGKNFQDHISFDGLSFTFTNNSNFQNIKKIEMLYNKWFETKKGKIGSVGPVACSGFVKTGYSKKSPDLQIIFDSSKINFDGSKLVPYSNNIKKDYVDYNVINAYPVLMRPKSTGFIEMNPLDCQNPIIHPEYLQHPEDLETLVDGVQLILNLLKTKPLKNLGATLIPFDLSPCQGNLNTRDYWRCVIRHYTKSMGFSGGTCKMGRVSDPMTVVNQQLQVIGVNRLRVIDSSIMPTITSAVSHAPVMMIAEVGADIIKSMWKNASVINDANNVSMN